MPLKLKLPGGDSSKRNKTPTKSPSHHSSTERKCPPSKSQRHHSSNVAESVPATSSISSPRDEDFSPVFDGTNNNCSPVLSSPQSAPENYANFPPQLEPIRRPKSMSEPLQPEDVGVRSKESKPGKNRAFSVSRSGKFKEAKRRTSLLEIQDRFDNAAKGASGNLGSPSSQPSQDKL